jgi:hypothetical protein
MSSVRTYTNPENYWFPVRFMNTSVSNRAHSVSSTRVSKHSYALVVTKMRATCPLLPPPHGRQIQLCFYTLCTVHSTLWLKPAGRRSQCWGAVYIRCMLQGAMPVQCVLLVAESKVGDHCSPPTRLFQSNLTGCSGHVTTQPLSRCRTCPYTAQ